MLKLAIGCLKRDDFNGEVIYVLKLIDVVCICLLIVVFRSILTERDFLREKQTSAVNKTADYPKQLCIMFLRPGAIKRCFVTSQKIACTNWKKTLLVLKGYFNTTKIDSVIY